MLQERPLEVNHSILTGKKAEETLVSIHLTDRPLLTGTGELRHSHLNGRRTGELAFVFCLESDNQTIDVKSIFFGKDFF